MGLISKNIDVFNFLETIRPHSEALTWSQKKVRYLPHPLFQLSLLLRTPSNGVDIKNIDVFNFF